MLPYPKDGKYHVAGDWHANYPQAKKAIQEAAKEGVDTIIHVGDFGFYPNDSFLKGVSNLCRRHGVTLYAIDGNHEDFEYLYTFPVDEETNLRKVRAHVYHVPRNTRWTWDETTYLALGGAASIDRDIRIRMQGRACMGERYWWPEEALTNADIETAVAHGHADVMFTHDCPSTLPNPITSNHTGQMSALSYFGEPVMQYVQDHQRRLAEVTNAVKPFVLIHGHYHTNYASHYRHEDGTPAYGIGLNQGFFEGNVLDISVDGMKALVESVKGME